MCSVVWSWSTEADLSVAVSVMTSVIYLSSFSPREKREFDTRYMCHISVLHHRGNGIHVVCYVSAASHV